MANIFTYSFEDTTVTVEHPAFGVYSAYGTGIGSVSVSMSNDVSSHQTAADLAVVISKHFHQNGTVTFDILQSSDFNSFMQRIYNYLKQAPASEFGLTNIIVRNRSTGRTYTCTGCTPQKLPDDQYQSQASNRQWAWLAANVKAQ